MMIVIGIVWQLMPLSKESPPNQKINQKRYDSPISYDVENWQIAPKKSLDDIQAIVSLAGTGARQDTGLDFDGLPNTLYRFHSSTDAPFYVGVSDNYLEIVWYYASPTDDEHQKSLSLAYAKKAYGMTSAIIGDKSQAFFQALLQQNTKVIKEVKYAHCGQYQCQIVFER